MAKGRSLHIGLNGVDSVHYGGWDGALNACEADARDMKQIADAQGFQSRLLLTPEATSKNVLDAISEAAGALQAGDFFFLSNSSHGGQVPDTNGDEDDDMDETWVSWDRQIVDDELYALWGKFASGVRIFVLSDSCHSGTVLKAALFGGSATPQSFGNPKLAAIRAMPPDVVRRTYQQHRELYDGIQKANPKSDRVDVSASVLLVSGCQDNQTSQDGEKNGLFTGTLKEVWNGGAFKGGYRAFRRAIVAKMPPTQTPNLFRAGVVSEAFEKMKPFAI